MKVGIIGLGVIGKACQYGFEKLGHKVFVHDIALDTKIEDVLGAQIVYVCVPTPTKIDGTGACDTSIVESVVEELITKGYSSVIAIKSTVEPATTQGLIDKYNNDQICFVPEFLRERAAFSDFTECHTLLAVGTGSDCVYDLVVECHGKYPKNVVKLCPTEAEILKYFSNSWNATRIIFSNSIYEICEALGADYTKIKDSFILRGTASNTYMDVNENFRGYGGVCIVPETKLYINGSIKTADCVKVGDKVLTIDGTFQEIKEIYTREIDEDIYKIRAQGLDSFCVTGNHPIYAIHADRKICGKTRRKLTNYKKDTYDFDWSNVEDLKKGDFVALPKICPDIRLIDGITVDVARLCGYYVAEGSIEKRSRSKNRIGFAFHTNEVEYHQDIEEIIKIFGLTAHYYIRGNKCALRFSNAELRELLQTHCGSYSWEKELSEDFMNLPDEHLKEFLKGYFRGDGSASTGIISCATVSEKLFYQLKQLLLRFEIAFTTAKRSARVDKNGVNHRQVFTIEINNYGDILNMNDIIDFNVQKVLKLQRKTKFFDNNLMVVPVKDIGIIPYKGTVYNFHVANNNTYVINDAIVHNCLPKDTKALDNLSKKLNLDLDFFGMLERENKKFKTTVFEGMRPE